MTPGPFEPHIADDALAELRQRLSRTRLPDRAPGERWAYGTDPDWLGALVAYWHDRFDWRTQEARLDAWPQFMLMTALADANTADLR